MKSLLEIQQEIRELSGAVKELQASLEGISGDIGELRSSGSGEELDYEDIARTARNIHINQHPLDLKDDMIKEMCTELLLVIAGNEPDSRNLYKKLAFVQAVKEAWHIDIDLRELQKRSLLTDENTYKNLCESLTIRDKVYLMPDMLITANFCGRANAETFELIADISDIFALSKEQMEEAIEIAKAVLTNDYSFPGKSDEQAITLMKLYGHYIDDKICSQRIESSRSIDVQSLGFSLCDWKVPDRSRVKKGQLIAYGTPDLGSSNKNFYASREGYIFQFMLGNIFGCIPVLCGVISAYQDDSIDSIRAWVKKQMDNTQ